MEFIGRNSIKNLDGILKNYNRILFFHGETVYHQYNSLFEAVFDKKSITYYHQISNNPKYEEISKAITELSASSPEIIIAFGGGSVIDFAKAYKFYQKLSIPLVAIPTTAGTGSEATQFAVIYVNGVKTSLDDISILPNTAIVDSQFIENAPQYIKACTAMDAYCQAIESFWAKKATDESRTHALKAIELCRDYLVKAVTSKEQKANEQMALAAHLAGKAINISRTTAAHALSYKITSQYGIPHGHAVALTIARLFVLNLGYFEKEEILLNTLNLKKDNIISYFHQLMEDIGLKDSFAQLGIKDKTDIKVGVNKERLSNNPKELTGDDIDYLLSENSK